MTPTPLPPYRYTGARALVELHEHYLREFLVTWREAKARSLPLPETTDPDYESLEHVLRHVLRAARGYMVWMCRVLELPDPGIDEAPEVDTVERTAEDYIAHVVDRWRRPLAEVDEERFSTPEYEAPWKIRYCVDAMIEHAVMHPLRHEYQLRRLMESSS